MEMDALKGILPEIRRSGNKELADSIQSSIEELRVVAAEAAAEAFQADVDAVANSAQKDMAMVDRAQRLIGLGGVTDYAGQGRLLSQRGSIMSRQYGQYGGLLAQAQAEGNFAQIEALTNAMADLEADISENTQAIVDNTNAAFTARTETINEAFGFYSSVIGAAQGFFGSLGTLTGIPQTEVQSMMLRDLGGALGTQRAGLSGQLADLLGYTGAERDNLVAMQGEDLVRYLMSISAGPIFESIMQRLDPTQEADFKSLVQALIGNAQATIDNTDQIKALTAQNDAQSYSSSAWQIFRHAIFNGSGGLLPQYTMPIMHSGGWVNRTGPHYLEAGERVLSRRDAGGGGGDTHYWNITSPTEVLDPDYVAEVFDFKRSTKRATQP
jgi:hypothetical protein